MSNHPRLIETRLATLERADAAVVEVRVKPDVKLDAEGFGEIVRAKRQLCSTEAADILVVLPPEVDFDLNLLAVDHHALNGGCGLSKRLALAASSAFNERLARIYFRYHPRDGETAVFIGEEEARAWLAHPAQAPSLS